MVPAWAEEQNLGKVRRRRHQCGTKHGRCIGRNAGSGYGRKQIRKLDLDGNKYGNRIQTETSTETGFRRK
ncbi:MAG: hypothetical protein NC254_12010 [bacterium]|nr:hypothetical protein [bacterium]